MFVYTLSIFSLLVGCDAKKGAVVKGSDISMQSEVPETDLPTDLEEQEKGEPVLSEEKIAFYKGDFPDAARFQLQEIPLNLLHEKDQSNQYYYDVLDANDTVIGYLRDFMGPVTYDDDCACSPLSLTLTYNADYSLRNILSVAPLQKYGHAALTEEEHVQMVTIAKNPSPELLELSAPQDMLDGTTGATKLAYKDKVVAQAGYSSWRISTLALETSQILQGAPMRRDRDLFQKLIWSMGDSSLDEKREKLISVIESTESDYLKERVVRMLADLYLRELAQREAKDAETEKAILSSGLGDLTEGRILTEVCLAFIEQRTAPSLVSSCIQKMEQNKHQEVYGPHVSILKGLDLFGKGKGKEAIPFLDDGMAKLEVSPDFREEIAGIYKELGESKKACAQFESIYIDAPRWPGLQENLAECGSVDTLTEKLDSIRKESILNVRIENPQVVSPLVLSDESDNALSLELSKDSKLRVLVFFATWCPHCQEEMPHLVEFYGQLQESDLKDKAEIVAVRTAISRESLEFSLFKKVFKIPFEIMTDKGITFETFAKEQGIQASYPTVAVANQKGEIVYYLPRNSHGETSKELFWLLRSLL